MAIFNKPEFNSVWASGGVKLPPESAKISQGWVVEIPPYEFDNWIRNRQDAMLAHINQAGVVSWDSTVEYQAGKSYVQGVTTGNIYRALTTHTAINPETDANGNWEIAFERSGTALLRAQNLADVSDKALARHNLGIATTEDYDQRYLQKWQNLADVPNKATARANLGIATTEDYDQRYLQKWLFLADVPDKAAARANLGIVTTEEYDQRYLQKWQNLADVPNKATARNNLGLGNSAVLDVGTVGNTVAAGNDSRIVNAVQNSRQVIAGNGLTGGGNLGADRTITLGTPSTITATSGNSISVSSHSHAIDVASLFPFQRSSTTSIGIGGLILKTGISPGIGDGGSVYITFPTPFPNACINIQATQNSGATWNSEASHVVVTEISRTGFRLHYNSTLSISATAMYLAIGY